MNKYFQVALTTLTLSFSAYAEGLPSLPKDAACNLFDLPKNVSTVVTFNDYFNKDKTQEKFETIAHNVTDLYTDMVKELGGNLKVTMLWDSNENNAYASKFQSNWEVIFHGGLFKDRRVTEDGFALTVCHELGHLLGGAPFKLGQETSAEGQADYWATSVCIKKYFETYPKAVTINDGPAKKSCDAKFASNLTDLNTCYRATQAGLSLATFLGNASEGKTPSFNNPDRSAPPITNQMHPLSQCRLDTYLAGSTCILEDTSVAFEEKLLTDKLITDYRCDEVIDGQISKVEKRPKCWFNELNNSVFANYEPKINVKTLFGYAKGKIYLSYYNHLPGVYKITLKNDSFSGAYVDIINGEHTATLPAAGEIHNIPIDYKFKRNTREPQKLGLVVERDGVVILKMDNAVVFQPK